MRKSRLYQNIPYLYFIAIWSWIAIGGFKVRVENFTLLTFCVPFVYQLFKEKKGLNLLLGILMMCWSILILLAYISDAMKINMLDSSKTISFIIGGGVLVMLNFFMSFKLILKALKQNSSDAQIPAASSVA
jgi:hypothetical protein